MKVKQGINPDFSDTEELDVDALEALSEYEYGTISFEELKYLVGAEAASNLNRKIHPEESEEGCDPDRLFDDPENL